MSERNRLPKELAELLDEFETGESRKREILEAQLENLVEETLSVQRANPEERYTVPIELKHNGQRYAVQFKEVKSSLSETTSKLRVLAVKPIQPPWSEEYNLFYQTDDGLVYRGYEFDKSESVEELEELSSLIKLAVYLKGLILHPQSSS